MTVTPLLGGEREPQESSTVPTDASLDSTNRNESGNSLNEVETSGFSQGGKAICCTYLLKYRLIRAQRDAELAESLRNDQLKGKLEIHKKRAVENLKRTKLRSKELLPEEPSESLEL